MKRKVIATVLALAMTMSMLAGCGSKKEETPQAPAAEAPAETPAAEEEEKGETEA